MQRCDTAGGVRASTSFLIIWQARPPSAYFFYLRGLSTIWLQTILLGMLFSGMLCAFSGGAATVTRTVARRTDATPRARATRGRPVRELAARVRGRRRRRGERAAALPGRAVRSVVEPPHPRRRVRASCCGDAATRRKWCRPQVFYGYDRDHRRLRRRVPPLAGGARLHDLPHVLRCAPCVRRPRLRLRRSVRGTSSQARAASC